MLRNRLLFIYVYIINAISHIYIYGNFIITIYTYNFSCYTRLYYIGIIIYTIKLQIHNKKRHFKFKLA